MLFLFDGSSGVGTLNFPKFINFAKKFIQPFSISKNKTNIAAGVFSDIAKISFPFNKHYDKQGVVTALGNIPYPNKDAHNLKDALTKARNEAFTTDRDNVTKVIIILTKNITENVTIAAQALKSNGVKIHVIAIAGDRRDPLIRDVPSAPREDHLFTPPSFADLEPMLPDIIGDVIAG